MDRRNCPLTFTSFWGRIGRGGVVPLPLPTSSSFPFDSDLSLNGSQWRRAIEATGRHVIIIIISLLFDFASSSSCCCCCCCCCCSLPFGPVWLTDVGPMLGCSIANFPVSLCSLKATNNNTLKKIQTPIIIKRVIAESINRPPSWTTADWFQTDFKLISNRVFKARRVDLARWYKPDGAGCPAGEKGGGGRGKGGGRYLRAI